MAYFNLEVTDALVQGQKLTSVVYIDNYTVAMRKDGKTPYIVGTIRKLKQTCPFKVWDAPIVKFFEDNDMRKQYLNVTFTGSEWNGSREVVFKAINPSDGVEIDTTEFELSLDCKGLFAELGNYINNNLEAKWTNVVNLVFSVMPDMYVRFSQEFAGASMHDAIKGGLINHTLKMLRLFDVLLASDERLKEYAGLIRTGIILHDIGKLDEMLDGAYQKGAFIINHRLMGLGYLERKRDDILQHITKDELIRLESIVATHHAGLGVSEECSTIYAYIVHLIDMLDSQVTQMMDKIDSESAVKLNSANEKYLTVNEKRLYI